MAKKFKLTKKEKRKFELRALHVVLAVLVGLVLAGWLVLWQTGQDKSRVEDMRQQAQKEAVQPEVPPNAAKIGGPIDLIDQDGKHRTDADFAGKYLLIYFGYTYCPDMCPTGLQSMSRALDQLGDGAKKVQPLFVTIDPARDTPSKMKEYISSFHPSIIGLTGSADQIAKIAKEYQVYYKKGENVDEHDYIMDHSSLIFLMDPQGKFVATYPEEVDPNIIVKALGGTPKAGAKPAAPASEE
jgi:protein SCO1/2